MSESSEALAAQWKQKRKAEIDSGEYCYRCRKWIFCLKAPGYQRLCSSCRAVDESTDEVVHDSLIRCPKCGDQRQAYGGDNYDLLTKGEHDVMCHECEHEFEVSTYVIRKFKSPKRIVEGEVTTDE